MNHPPAPPIVPIPSERERQIAAQMDPSRRLETFIEGLPRISEAKLAELGQQESSCSICYNTFLAVIAEEEMALAMDSPVYPVEELGVTKLDRAWQCGHMFCRRDIIKWVQQGRRTCPMCRRGLFEPIPGLPDEEGEGSAFNNMVWSAIEANPRLLLMASALNVDVSALFPPPSGRNQVDFEEMRRVFFAANPHLPSSPFDGISPSPPPDASETPPSTGMYS